MASPLITIQAAGQGYVTTVHSLKSSHQYGSVNTGYEEHPQHEALKYPHQGRDHAEEQVPEEKEETQIVPAIPKNSQTFFQS